MQGGPSTTIPGTQEPCATHTCDSGPVSGTNCTGAMASITANATQVSTTCNTGINCTILSPNPQYLA